MIGFKRWKVEHRDFLQVMTGNEIKYLQCVFILIIFKISKVTTITMNNSVVQNES